MRTVVKWKVDDAVDMLKDLVDLIESDDTSIKDTTKKWLSYEINKAIEMLGGKIDEQDKTTR
tara:strand:- start:802 stop:987 length:186 start_codon:yes stop_codon:yes gene_type:complete